ncbi:hypothetical protein [Streptosporangium roseum]|uniref:hypothetical protein n=1 Tax=Streptosporangium roseum TaxID=2001 RepID=UPI00331F75B3
MAPEPLSGVTRTALRLRLEWNSSLGDRAYHLGHHVRAAELYGRCADLAEMLGDVRAQAFALVGQAGSLLLVGRTTEAMAAVARALPGGPAEGPPEVVLDALGIWYDAARAIPAELPVIEGTHRMAEEFIRGNGLQDRRYVLLLQRANLQYDRGYVDEALALAREAWTLRRLSGRDAAFGTAHHLYQLVFYAGRAGDPASARKALADLERLRDADADGPLQRQEALLEARTEVAWGEGRHDEAVGFQTELLRLTPGRSGAPDRAGDTSVNLVWAQVVACRLWDARAGLIALSHLRHASLWEALAYRELLGEYHLSAARWILGLPPMGFDYQVPGPPVPPDPAWPRSAAEEARRARALYLLADRIGSRLDAKLRGRHSRDRLARRFKLLDELPL